jgi:glutathione S-transferase
MAGRAEVCRLILEDAGVDYEFVPVPFPQWPELKSNLSAAGTITSPLLLHHPQHHYTLNCPLTLLGVVLDAGKLPFGQLPLYEEPSGLALVQSNAIARYLAKKHGYLGATDEEAALVDQMSEGVVDMLNAIAKVLWFTPADKVAEEKEKLIKETLPAQLTLFVKLLDKNGNTGFLVGDKVRSHHHHHHNVLVVLVLHERLVTNAHVHVHDVQLSLADLGLWVALQLVFIKAPEGRDSLTDAFPSVAAFLDAISQRPRILAYLTRDVYP